MLIYLQHHSIVCCLFGHKQTAKSHQTQVAQIVIQWSCVTVQQWHLALIPWYKKLQIYADQGKPLSLTLPTTAAQSKPASSILAFMVIAIGLLAIYYLFGVVTMNCCNILFFSLSKTELTESCFPALSTKCQLSPTHFELSIYEYSCLSNYFSLPALTQNILGLPLRNLV